MAQGAKGRETNRREERPLSTLYINPPERRRATLRDTAAVIPPPPPPYQPPPRKPREERKSGLCGSRSLLPGYPGRRRRGSEPGPNRVRLCLLAGAAAMGKTTAG